MLGSRGLNFKIRFGFGIIVFLTALVGGLGWFGVEKLNRQLSAFSEWVAIDTVMHSTITTNIASLKYDIEIYTDSPSRERFDDLITSQENIRLNIKSWGNRFASSQEVRETAAQALLHLDEIEAATRQFQEKFDNLDLANTFEAVAVMQEGNAQLVQVFATVMSDTINPAKKREMSEAAVLHRQIFQSMLVLVSGGILLGVILSFWITRTITKPIRTAIADLTNEAENGETSSSKFSDTNHQLADAATQQSAALEETAASLEEISSQTRSNTTHAGQAEKLMSETASVLAEVDKIMGDLKRSMDQISEKSDDTQKIVKTIDEIAFQTNLLALNAAVEAARAGEEGLGFAVVADEVRNLAMRAGEASHDTAEQIRSTVQIIASGADLVGQTIEAFTKANEKSAQTTTLVSEISSASHEQLQGIQQLSAVAGEMERTTQWTAASAQEVAFASESMQEQAMRIKKTVDNLARLIHGGDGGVKPMNTKRKADPMQPEPTTAEIAHEQKPERRSLPFAAGKS